MCKNRGWFTDYTEFKSVIRTPSGVQNTFGIGSVIIPTLKSPSIDRGDNHGKLVLHNVLHVPSTSYNIFGYTGEVRKNLHVSLDQGGLTSIFIVRNKEGERIAYIDDIKVYQIKLSAPPDGKSFAPINLENMCGFNVRVEWDESEVARWKAYRQNSRSSSTPKKDI